jgi:hypothetical protein
MRNMIAAGLAALAFAVPISTPAANATGYAARTLNFDVTQNGNPFGTHRIVVTPTAEGARVNVAINLRATAGPVTVFSYAHTCTETWRGTALAALDCTTRRGSRSTRVTATTAPNGGLTVAGPSYSGAVAAGVLPSSWWNIAVMRSSRMLNTDNGRVENIRVRTMGRENVTVAGRSVSATRYQLTGTIVLDAWYDGSDRLVKLGFTTQGRRIEYALRG